VLVHGDNAIHVGAGAALGLVILPTWERSRVAVAEVNREPNHIDGLLKRATGVEILEHIGQQIALRRVHAGG